MATEQKRTEFDWTEERHLAAQLLAEDELSDATIAERCGVGRTALSGWKKHPTFAARVKEITEAIGAAGLHRAIAKRAARVRVLDEQLSRLQRIIDERADDPDMEDVPGGKTGLLVRRIKGIGSREQFREVEEYEVDAALLREIREHMKQAAQELGQWTEKQELTGKDGSPLVGFVNMPGIEPD